MLKFQVCKVKNYKRVNSCKLQRYIIRMFPGRFRDKKPGCFRDKKPGLQPTKKHHPGNNEKLYIYCFDVGLKENKIKFRDDRDLFTHIIKLF